MPLFLVSSISIYYTLAVLIFLFVMSSLNFSSSSCVSCHLWQCLSLALHLYFQAISDCAPLLFSLSLLIFSIYSSSIPSLSTSFLMFMTPPPISPPLSVLIYLFWLCFPPIRWYVVISAGECSGPGPCPGDSGAEGGLLTALARPRETPAALLLPAACHLR